MKKILKRFEVMLMTRFKCLACGYIYDEEKGDPLNKIKPGTPFAKLPDGWVCPECGMGKDMFETMEE